MSRRIPDQRIFCVAFALLAFRFTSSRAFAHDPLEISATAYLHTNRVELRIVMLRPTIIRAADAQGVHLLDFSIPSERDEAMPVLRSQAAGLFTLTSGTNLLHASESSVIIGAEDHVGFNLVYPATNSPLRLDAKILGCFPTNEPYAISLIVLDMENNKVLEQKILTAQIPTLEFALPQMPRIAAWPSRGFTPPAPLERRSPTRRDDAPSPKPAGPETGAPK